MKVPPASMSGTAGRRPGVPDDAGWSLIRALTPAASMIGVHSVDLLLRA